MAKIVGFYSPLQNDIWRVSGCRVTLETLTVGFGGPTV